MQAQRIITLKSQDEIAQQKDQIDRQNMEIIVLQQQQEKRIADLNSGELFKQCVAEKVKTQLAANNKAWEKNI